MADKTVGIKIVAKDMASKVLKGTGVSAKKAGEAVRGLSKAISGTGKAFGDAMTRWNQTLEIVNKLRNGIRMLVLDTTAKAIEFRSAMDPISVWYREQAREIELVSARVGDIWLPLMKGWSDAIAEVSGSTSKLVKENRKLIGSKVIEYFEPFAGVLAAMIKGVAIFAQGILGLKLIFQTVSAAFKVLLVKITDGFASLAYDLSQFAQRAGMDELEQDLLGASVEFVKMRENARKSSDETIEGMQATAESIAAVGAKANEAADAIERIAARAAKLSAIELAKDPGGGGATEAEAQTRAAIILKLEARIAAGRESIRAANMDRMIAISNKELAAYESAEMAKRDMTLATTEMSIGAIRAWAGSAMDASNSARDNFRAFGKAATDALLSMAEKAIAAQAAQAAAGAASSQSMIPIVGPALGAAAAAAMFGLVRGYLAKFALGGEVHGGTPGRDSVPALLMPGEKVLTPSQARQHDKGGGQTVNITVSPTLASTVPPTREQMEDIGAQLVPVLERAVADGRANLRGA